jgi:hypothetical protein
MAYGVLYLPTVAAHTKPMSENQGSARGLILGIGFAVVRWPAVASGMAGASYVRNMVRECLYGARCGLEPMTFLR